MFRLQYWLMAGLVLALVAGCANHGGLLGSGLYKTRIGGPMAQRGMTPQQVVHVMGPSHDTAGGYHTEVWRYGVNILGLVGPSCQRGGRGADVMCINVYFYEGRVADVVSY